MANLQRLCGIIVGILALVWIGISLNSLSGDYSVVVHLILVLGFVSLGVYVGAVFLGDKAFAAGSFCFVALYFFLYYFAACLYFKFFLIPSLGNDKFIKYMIVVSAFFFIILIPLFLLVQGYLGLRELEKIDKQESDAAKPMRRKN